MAAVLDKPAEDGLTYVSFPIQKFERDEDGDLIVYGKATDGSVDSDEQIVDPQWARKAIQDWYDTGANVRKSHDPRSPVGRGLAIELGDDGHFVKTLVVDRDAQRLVEKGVLRAYSVGISRPVIDRDITGKARGGIIKGGEFAEISLVDRPANRNCGFTLVKAAGDGTPEWVGKMYGDPAFLAKAVTPTPGDVAMIVKRRQEAGGAGHTYSDPIAQRLADALAAETEPEFVGKRVTASGRVVDSSGQDRSDVSSGDFAGPGKTFPIETPGDVSDAASLAHHAKNPGKVRARIRSIARRKFPGKKLPPSLDTASKSDETADFTDAEGINKDSVALAVAAGEVDAVQASRFLGYDETWVAKAGVGADGSDSEDSNADHDDDDDDGMSDAAVGTRAKQDDEPEVVKAKKPKKGGKPFGGKKAMPFGAKPDGDADDDDAGKSADPEAIKAEIARLEGMLAKCVPTAVNVQHTPPASPTPPPRGGASIDSIDTSVVAAEPEWMRLGKAMNRTTDAPYAAQRAHDATCAAYHPAAVKAAYPSLAHPGDAVDAGELKEAAMTAVASGDLAGGENLLGVAKAAEYLAAADPAAVTDAAAGLHKSFTDMYPSVRLSPGQVMPSQFDRPYISSGHANAPAPSGDVSPGTVPSYHPAASDFRRGPITAGQASASPGNKGDSNPYPSGTPAGQVYDHAVMAQQASAALRTIHDHYAARWNGVCPMRMTAGPVTPGPAAAVKGKKGKKKRALNATAVPGAMDPVPTISPSNPATVKAVAPEVTTGTDITVLLAQMERRLKKVQARQDEQVTLIKQYESRMQSQDAEVTSLRRDVETLGGKADIAGAPPRAAIEKAATSPAERRSLVDEAGQQRAERIAFAQSLAMSGNAGEREMAYAQLDKLMNS